MYPVPSAPKAGIFIEQQVKGLRSTGVEVDVLLANRSEDGILCYLQLAGKVRQKVVEYKPDLVHVMYGGVLARIVTKAISDVPVIVSYCGTDLIGADYYPLYRRIMIDEGVRSSRIAAKMAKGVILKSNRMRDYLPEGVDPERVWVVPNGVDLSLLKPMVTTACKEKLGWDAGRFHVLFPASADNLHKRFELAVGAVKLLTQQGIPAVIHPVKGVLHDDIPVWLNAADVVILTSRHEGSPNVIKEALACNKPVVSVDVGDVAERIEGVIGCHIAEPTPSSLAEKLTLVYHGERSVRGDIAMKGLSLEETAERLKSIYTNVIERWQSN